MPQYQVYFDTLEGEKRYDVDIGNDEALERVLHDILGELAERGHMMRGFSTGDLKVIWGGREGRELDLARTLPEQSVRPNDVLRVLVDMYVGGMHSLRRDRVEREWLLLARFGAANRKQIEILDRWSSPVEEIFSVRLHDSPGVQHADGSGMTTSNVHTVKLCFTRFYPEVPLECYVEGPLFHPNVKSETGFVCLWDQTNPRDTVVQALARMQAVAAYRMVNLAPAHVMNREAAEWYRVTAFPQQLVPLTWEELKVFEVRNGRIVWLDPSRQRASSPSSTTPLSARAL
jgi:hypothetical protein